MSRAAILILTMAVLASIPGSTLSYRETSADRSALSASGGDPREVGSKLDPRSPSGLSGIPLTPAPNAATGCPPHWALASGTDPSGRQDILTATTAVSSQDAWAVGSAGGKTLVERWTGQTWRAVKSPNAAMASHALAGVDASSSTDAWAVGWYEGPNGNQSLILHYDGTRWNLVSTPTVPGEDVLTSVIALSSTEAWAVGYSLVSAEVRMLVLHYDGSAWSVVPGPNPAPPVAYLYAVSATSPADVWAVGDYYDRGARNLQTLAIHYNGSAWAIVPTPNRVPGTANLLQGIAVESSSDAWAVGFANGLTNFAPIILRWDGSVWKITDPPGLGRLFSVTAVARGDVWAVGENPAGTPDAFFEHWDGITWTQIPVSLGETLGRPPWWLDGTLLGVSSHPSGRVLAVGAGWKGKGLGYMLCEVTVQEQFSLQSADVSLGNAAVWSFPTSNVTTHGVKDDTGLALFDSGLRPPGSSFTFSFVAPGVFSVLDPRTLARMSLNVPIQVDPAQGGIRTKFNIVWAAEVLPGLAFDVQIRRPGSSSWEGWGTTGQATHRLFTPDAGKGTYMFRARTRDPATGAASDYSSPTGITVG